MIQITKTFTFDAGHRLSDYEGKCKQLHGHTYKCEITVEGDLDNRCMIMDFTDLKKAFKEEIDRKFDHRFLMKKGDILNEEIAKVLPTGDNSICWVEYNPTAENIASDIFEIIKRRLSRLQKGDVVGVKVVRVRLYETPTSCADVVG